MCNTYGSWHAQINCRKPSYEKLNESFTRMIAFVYKASANSNKVLLIIEILVHGTVHSIQNYGSVSLTILR